MSFSYTYQSKTVNFRTKTISRKKLYPTLLKPIKLSMVAIKKTYYIPEKVAKVKFALETTISFQ